MDKDQLFQQLLQKLETRLKLLVDSAFEAKEASTNEESKAENKYDTRGLEASYLAAGQAKRAQELQEQIFKLKKVTIKKFAEDEAINVSALVHLLVGESQEKIVFLLPIGGEELELGNRKVQTLTFDAPLGKNLYGLSCGDDFSLNSQLYEIQEVY